MPTFYNFTQDGLTYSFDDIFVPADLFREGNLFTWGYFGAGRLATNDSTSRPTPVTTFAGGTNWKQVSSGYRNSAAIKTDGTLWVWGSNFNGQLGDNTVGNKFTPVTTFAGGTNWNQVSTGYNCLAAIKTDGTLWVWGSPANGQLGNGVTTGTISTPVTTFAGGTNWKQVSCGTGRIAAIKTDGTLWSWGSNTTGVLGTNDATNRSTPVTTFAGGTNWKQVSMCNNNNRCGAVKTDGTLWVWGVGGPELGITIIDTARSTPVTTFAGGTNWKQIDMGRTSSAAIKTDGTLWMWGATTYGKLGNNVTLGLVSTPITTFSGGNDWKQVSAGGDQGMAIKTDGTLWVWGRGGYGRLGTNDSTSRPTPVTTFAGGTNWKQVSSGNNHSAALTYIDPVYNT